MTFTDRINDIDKLKKEIDAYRPLPQHLIPMLKEYYRIGLTYSTNALEGNTLSETETKVIVEDGLTIGGKTLREHLEVYGHSEAYDFMHKKAAGTTILESDILEMHRLFYYRIDPACAGCYRQIGVLVTGTDFEFPKPQQVPDLMKAFCQELAVLQKNYHPVHYAALVHLKLVTIQPFVDGNGRTARLLMNLALLQQGYPITIIPPVMRATYLACVNKGNRGDDQGFIWFISQMVYESTKELLRLIRSGL